MNRSEQTLWGASIGVLRAAMPRKRYRRVSQGDPSARRDVSGWPNRTHGRHVYCVLCSRPGRALQAHTGLEGHLGRASDSCRLFPGIWLVTTREPADQLYQRLIRFFSGDDQIVILEVGEQTYSWLPQHVEARRWLRRHLPNRSWSA